MATDPSKYTFDPEERVFLDKFGRRVDRNRVRASLDTYIDSITADIRADTQSMVDGDLSIGAWHLKMEGHIKRSHTAAAAIAKGGWKQAKGHDWALAGREIKEQYQYLYRFARQLEAGRPVNGGTVARAEMYGLSATKTYEGILRRDDLLEGFDLERRLLHSKVPCTQCKYYADLGWVVAGTLPDIGEQCQCLTRCRCSFERKRSKEAQKRRRDAKPKIPKPPTTKKPPVEPLPPVVIPTATPKPKPPVTPPKVPKPKPVAMPKPVVQEPPPKPVEPPKPPPSDDPAARIEAARAAQREANRKHAELNPNSEYASLQKKFPDLIPPGTIQDRLGRYTLGDEKAKAIQEVGVKYQTLAATLEADRQRHNNDLMKLFKEKDSIQAPYKGSSKPVPNKVAERTLELQRQIEEATRLRDEARVRMNGLASERRKEAHQFLKVKDGATFLADAPDPENFRERKYTEATGEDHVARGDKSTVEVAVGVGSDGRAFYTSGSPRALITVSQYTTVKTIVHELGHGIDHQFETGASPGVGTGKNIVRKRSKEFLEYRVGDEQPVSMNALAGGGYRDFEEGRKDKFNSVHELNSAYYTGHTTAVETLTMGIQEMWDDPVKFATKDPEWFKFVAGVMDGSLR
jgi:hypothetical protein